MNIIKRIWGSESSSGEAVMLSPGELWINRPESSPKAGKNSIFSEAQLTLSKPSEDYVSELIVCPLDINNDSQGSDYDDTDNDLRRLESERTFLVDSALKVAYFDSNGTTVVSWVDPEGDVGDRYEFVCGEGIGADVLQKFDTLCRTVQYGRKYGRNPPNVQALDEFDFDNSISAPKSAPPKPKPVSEVQGTSLYQVGGDVCLFDGNRRVFVLQQEQTMIHLVETAGFSYTLAAGALAIPITPNMNPISNDEHKAFIFNVEQDNTFVTYMIRFQDLDKLREFEQQFAILLWQSQNKIEWASVEQADREYISSAIAPEEGDTSTYPSDAVEDDDDNDGEEDGDGLEDPMSDEEEYKTFLSNKEVNSAMEVGHSKDRTYVVRGNNIGVFKTGDDVEYSTTITNVQDLNKNPFTAKHIMLHEQDGSLVMQNEANRDKLYRMDLEYGKVVDEWDMYGDVTAYAPVSKFAQSTTQKDLLATSNKSVYRIDPRLSGSKIVEDASKTYAKKMGFSAIATTEQGYVAVATKDGGINLYNQLGKRAKSAIPAVGDTILALDVTADGKWVLATFKTYLLLIETVDDQLNGFTKAFPKTARPRPRRLQISPDNAAYMYQESHKPLSFTPARFDTGPTAKEQSIITATGPYVVTWNMADVLLGKPNPYKIKRYDSVVTADNFKYNTDNRVLVTLEDNVGMVKKTAFRKPTRHSLLS